VLNNSSIITINEHIKLTGYIYKNSVLERIKKV